MAAQEVLEDPSEPTKYKKWILKVSIHCEGCKRKVKKILTQVEGVHEVDIDTKQQKVTVTGNVEGETLLRKLIKSGKHAKLWPENAGQKEKKSSKCKNKEKLTEAQETIEKPCQGSVKEIKPPIIKVEVAVQEPSENSQGGGVKDTDGGGGGGGVTKCIEESGGGASEVATSEGGTTIGGLDQVVKELKMEEKKWESGDTGGAQPPPAVEGKGVENNTTSPVIGKVKSGGGGNDGGSSGKMKRIEGQNGNSVRGEKSSATQEAMRMGKNHVDGPPSIPVPAHHKPTSHHGYDHYPPQYYGPSGLPPVYAVSYNTTNPTTSYTASYYASAPPNSYVYSHSGGPDVQAPPSDLDAHPRQPLDSFEIFSDENPNGCSIM
ncbi:hypothetical protein ACH5RR_022945 [Cinchona calisaya]|uniref:HMA domain-containing protein n=1 Tax=Cinchona calisaya TaxID=153742 RepID=A0ABD2Z9A5_9GENT